MKIWLRNGAFEVYLNKYVVSIAPFSTPAFTPPLTPHSENCSFLHVFAFYFFIHFSRGVSWPHLPLHADAHALGQYDGSIFATAAVMRPVSTITVATCLPELTALLRLVCCMTRLIRRSCHVTASHLTTIKPAKSGGQIEMKVFRWHYLTLCQKNYSFFKRWLESWDT